MWVYTILGLSLIMGGLWWKRRPVSYWIEKFEWMVRIAERIPSWGRFICERDKAKKMLRFHKHMVAVIAIIPEGDMRFKKPKNKLLALLGTFKVQFEAHIDSNWDIVRRRDLLPKDAQFENSRKNLSAIVARNDHAEEMLLTKMRLIVDQATAAINRADIEDQLDPMVQIDAVFNDFLELLGSIAPDAQNQLGAADVRQLRQSEDTDPSIPALQTGGRAGNNPPINKRRQG